VVQSYFTRLYLVDIHNSKSIFTYRLRKEGRFFMTAEYIVLQEIMTKHAITVSQLALKASLADSTVYEYTGGRKKNIPMPIWKALYEITKDSAILNLVIGEVETFVVSMPKEFDDSDATLQTLIEKRKKDIECETEILNILSDGKIDKGDFDAINKYKSVHPETIKLSNQIYHAITTEFKKITKQ